MDPWQHLKADNLRVSLIQVLPNVKICQGTQPKVPTIYTTNCVMFMCPRVSAPGICWYAPVGEGRGKGYNWEGEGKKTGCLISGDCTGTQSGPWCLVRPPAPAPLLAASVVMLYRLDGQTAGNGGPTKPSLLRPCASPLPSVRRSNSSHFWRRLWINDLMPFQQRNIDMLVCGQHGVLD